MIAVPNNPGLSQELFNTICARARARRERDIEEQRQKDLRPGGIPDPHYRARAILTYAYSFYTGHFYVGYSGGAGGMCRHGFYEADEMAWRRYNRIEEDLDGYGAPPLDRDFGNCGEAAALSIAKSYGERLQDLYFVSFKTADEEYALIAPCANCRVWIGGARGYWS